MTTTQKNDQTRTVPATGAVLVDISSTDHSFSPALRAISIGTAGDLKIDTPDDAAVTIPANALAIGVQHAIEIVKIYKVGTTADEMVGWR